MEFKIKGAADRFQEGDEGYLGKSSVMNIPKRNSTDRGAGPEKVNYTTIEETPAAPSKNAIKKKRQRENKRTKEEAAKREQHVSIAVPPVTFFRAMANSPS